MSSSEAHRVLVVDASPRRDLSTSRAATAAVLEGLRAAAPGVEVDHWDLWADPLPTFGADEVAAKMARIGGDEPEAAAWGRLVAAFERFDAADTYVFGVPMWNGGIPWALKLLIDTITQPGLVFGFDPATGYQGLLTGKRAATVYTSAVYRPGLAPGFGSDFQSTYFEDWLRFAGIEDISSLRIEPFGPADRDEHLSAAATSAREIGRTIAGV